MKQKIFTKDYAEILKSSVEENLVKYLDPNYSWDAAAEGNIKELDFEQPDLTGMMQYADTNDSKVDLHAAKILFEAYRNITPLQAAQHQFWLYLSHVVLYSYMRTRWNRINTADCPASYIQDHWFYKNGVMRNWLEGLYWSVKCSVIEKEDGTLDYTYTDMLFSIQKIRDRGLAAAPYIISNKEAVIGILKFYMNEKDKGEAGVFDKYFEYRTDKCIQLINKLGGSIELAEYNSDDFFAFLNANRDYIKSVGDRKKEKAERDAQNGVSNNSSKKKKKHRNKKRR